MIMSVITIHYDAKCKHCKHQSRQLNKRTNKYQAYCEVKTKFVRLEDKACFKLKL